MIMVIMRLSPVMMKNPLSKIPIWYSLRKWKTHRKMKILPVEQMC